MQTKFKRAITLFVFNIVFYPLYSCILKTQTRLFINQLDLIWIDLILNLNRINKWTTARLLQRWDSYGSNLDLKKNVV